MMKRIFCIALLALTVLMMPMAAAGATWVHSRDLGMRADNPRLPLAERQKTGRANADILRTFLERGTHLILDDTYYVTVDYRSLSAGGTRFLVIKHPLHLKGGGIRVKYFGFQMREGSSLTAEGVRFESDGVFPLIWNGGRSTNFGSDNVLLRGMIGSLRFTDCHFSCRMLQLGFADLAPLGVKVPKKKAGSEDFETDAKGRPVYKSASESVDSLGIGELVVERCTSDVSGVVFQTGDCRVYRRFSISHNRVVNGLGAFLHYGSNNNSSSAPYWMQGSCPLTVEHNTFSGVACNNRRVIYHCPILAETHTIYFRHNVVDNYLSASSLNEQNKRTGVTAYDNYLSCRRVYFEDNEIRNVFAYRAENTTERTMSAPYCEWGKSKGASRQLKDDPTCRIYRRNRWTLDDALVMRHLRGVAYGTDSTAAVIQLTDEERKGKTRREMDEALEAKRQAYIRANYRVSLLHTFASIDEVEWTDNVLDFGGAEVMCMKSVGKAEANYSAKYGRFVFTGNTVKARTLSGNLIVLTVPKDTPSLKADVTVSGNTFRFADPTQFCLIFRHCTEKGNGMHVPMGDVTVTDNRVVNGGFFLQPGLCGKAVVRGNQMDRALPREKTLQMVKAQKLDSDL